MSEVIRIPMRTYTHYNVLHEACELAITSINNELKRIANGSDWVNVSQSNSFEIQQFGILLQVLGKQLEYFTKVKENFPKTIAQGNCTYLQVERDEIQYLVVALNHIQNNHYNEDELNEIVQELQGTLFATQFYMTTNITHDTSLDDGSYWGATSEHKRAEHWKQVT